MLSKIFKLLSEKNCILCLITLFIITSAFILSYDYDLENPPTPDERAFYGWAKLYDKGIYKIPVEDVAGTYNDDAQFTVVEKVLNIDVKTISDDNDNKKNDALIKVFDENDIGLYNATVSIKEKTGTTDKNGEIVIKNIPFGNYRVLVRYQENETSIPIIASKIYESHGQGGYYGIIGTIEKIEINDIQQPDFKNATIKISDKNSTPISEIQLYHKNKYFGETNENGTITINEDQSFEFIQLRDQNNSTVQGLRILVNDIDFGESDNKGNVFLLGIAKVDLLISVTDIVGGKVSSAEIFLDDDLLGKSNENGELNENLELNIGEHQIRVVKENKDGVEPPMVSVVTEVDGKLYLVNHWPPGFCVVLMVFYKMGIVQYTNIILSALACISVYGISRRIFDYKTAFIAAILMMTTALAMYMVYSVEMADYATTAFTILGFWLFIEGVYSKKKFLSILLLILGGLMISTAVTMRYSTVVVAICPIVFLLVHAVAKTKCKINNKIMRNEILIPEITSLVGT